MLDAGAPALNSALASLARRPFACKQRLMRFIFNTVSVFTLKQETECHISKSRQKRTRGSGHICRFWRSMLACSLEMSSVVLLEQTPTAFRLLESLNAAIDLRLKQPCFKRRNEGCCRSASNPPLVLNAVFFSSHYQTSRSGFTGKQKSTSKKKTKRKF